MGKDKSGRYIIKNLALGNYARDGQRIQVKITEGGLLGRTQTWELAFGQPMSYVPQDDRVTIEFKALDLPKMQKDTMRSRSARRSSDYTFYVIEHPKSNIYGLCAGDLKYATAKAVAFPALRQYL
jgi:hypothetical protein